jgi:hypothetical protein
VAFNADFADLAALNAKVEGFLPKMARNPPDHACNRSEKAMLEVLSGSLWTSAP